MTTVNCPSCGKAIALPPRKSGFPWWAGCLIGVAAIIPVIAVIGILAGIAIPSFSRARQLALQKTCAANMKCIEGAKQQWALTAGHNNGKPDVDDLREFLPSSTELTCPAGGTYTINAVGEEPECSKHGTLSNPILRGTRNPSRPHNYDQ